MADRSTPPAGPDWLDTGDALRALPLEQPLHSAWPQIARHVQPRRRVRTRLLLLACAATLAAALLLPAWLSQDLPVGNQSTPLAQRDATPDAGTGSAASQPLLAALMHESAQLEALLAAAGDAQVGSGTSLLLQSRMQERVQLLDALLADAPTDASAELLLWQERVVLLRRLAGLESGEQLLAAHGNSADSSLVMTF